jgi:hypothetical protein
VCKARLVTSINGSQWQLWGTFSPADHLRKRAFVADVLIYDRLVVPVPAEDDADLWHKWERRWNPTRQAEFLDVIDAEVPGLLYRVPWTAVHDANWRAHAEGEQRLALAQYASSDVAGIQEAKAADPDSVGQYAERRYLVDFVNPRRDLELRGAVPPGELEVVTAYGSHHLFSRDVPVEIGSEADSDLTLLSAFAWPLVVPSNSRRSDADLLKEALELAQRYEARDYRLAFHRWRRTQPSGTTPSEARKELEEVIARYGDAMRRARKHTRLRIAGIVLTAGSAAGLAAAFTDPAAAGGIAASATGLGKYLEARTLRTRVPEYLLAGALFHEARERFRWA